MNINNMNNILDFENKNEDCLFCYIIVYNHITDEYDFVVQKLG